MDNPCNDCSHKEVCTLKNKMAKFIADLKEVKDHEFFAEFSLQVHCKHWYTGYTVRPAMPPFLYRKTNSPPDPPIIYSGGSNGQ